MRVKEGILQDNGITLDTLEVFLDNTTLLVIDGYKGFAMCGALDVSIYNSLKMKERKVVCFKATGVKTIEQLYNAPIVECSEYAKQLGIYEGMTVKDGFKILSTQ